MYFNGQPVGYNHPRPIGGWGFPVPGAMVKAGVNVIAFRLFSPVGKIGTFKDTYDFRLGDRLITGEWRAKVEFALPSLSDDARAALAKLPAFPDKPTPPGTSFNATIAPMAPYAIRGFTWYRGKPAGAMPTGPPSSCSSRTGARCGSSRISPSIFASCRITRPRSTLRWKTGLGGNPRIAGGRA